MFWTIFYVLWLLLSLAAICRLLTHKREPSSTLSWLFFVTTVPVAGSLLFFIFGPLRLERNAIKRKTKLQRSYPPSNVEEANRARVATERIQASRVFTLARRISAYEVTDGNELEILADPQVALRTMQEAIAAAETYIHLEYYIIASDEVTEQLFESLITARARGVEIRILYDSFGSLSLKRIHFRRLEEAGISLSGFLPLSLAPQRLNFNFRNHRKILIVDGRIAFTGGANIGKEYLGRLTDSQWRDYTFKVTGPVCLQLEDVFAQDWQFTTQEELSHQKYYPEVAKTGDAVIQVLESGPDSEFRILHRALLLAISSAQERIWLTTPYFIPDSAMIAALEIAALRGLDVRLIVPEKNDAPLVRWASRSFYDPLLKAGLKIFEYRPRTLHGKTILIDGNWTVLGSANMDIRSFRLNFELNLLVESPSLASQTAELFLEELRQSVEITLPQFSSRPWRHQIYENIARLFSPIL